MTRLDALRDRAQGALRRSAELIYRHQGVFTKVQNGREQQYACRFSVKDPLKLNRDTIGRVEAFAQAENAAFTDIRVLKVHPDDLRPPQGAALSDAWDGGQLVIRAWSQPSDLTDQAMGLCLLRR